MGGAAPPVRDRAVATPGDTEQHVEIDGVRYSHVVDPRTGLGLTTRVVVTITAEDGATADALAEAFGLRPESTPELLARFPGVERWR